MDIKNLKVNFEAKVLQADKVIIVPHNNVDFDAIGSAIGLAYIVKKLKKEPFILINDSNDSLEHGIRIVIDEAKKEYSIFNKEKYLEVKSDDDLIVLTDVNKKGRISIGDEVNNRENTIIIDHHNGDHTTLDSDNVFIDSDISSTSEIVTKLICLSKVKCPVNVANYLLAGIYLDTNRLSKNVTAETMKAVAKLMEYGADLNRVNDLFLEDFNSDRRVQDLVSRVEIVTYTIATILADENMIYSREELAKAADYLLKFVADASFCVGKIDENVVSISARSREKINVGEVMEQLDGGGNQYSAATKLQDVSIQEAGKRLLKVIEPSCYVKK